MSDKVVRTRFAPSPTGFLHVGGVRTALFAWLLARQNNGQFIVRLEDTDKAREVEGSAEHIAKSLHWLGIEWDEGFDIGGQFAPYKQSDRLESYKTWAQKLIDSGRAYADPYTPEEVDGFRKDCEANKKPFLYRDYRPENPPAWDGSQPLRFKSDPKNREWQDAVMGRMQAGAEACDDFVLIKTDGYPTYNFAHIVDDAEMKCSHVIRSQEFVSSIPRFLDLYEALGIEQPILATLPFVMAIDGKKKLGKRDGAKDILDYAREGILPEAMMNFLATLGWNDGTEQEIFSPQELTEKFDLSRVQTSPARFDEQRLHWMNGMHIRALKPEDLYKKVADYWPDEAKEASEDYKKQVLGLVSERLKLLSELPGLTSFFFADPKVDDKLKELILSETKLEASKAIELLEASIKTAESSDFTIDKLHDEFYKLAETLGSKPGELFKLIRIALVGGTTAPGLFETMAILGKETVIKRLNSLLSAL